MDRERYGFIRRNTIPLLRWSKWLVISLTLLLWVALAFWVVGRIIGPLIMIAVAALLAYAVYPLVKVVQRFVPRGPAILIVFLGLFILLSLLIYALVRVAVQQVELAVHALQKALADPLQSPLTPINDLLEQFGVSPQELKQTALQLLEQLQGLARNIVPFVTGAFGVVLNVLLVAALCVYILFSGPLVVNWLRYKTPLSQRQNINFLLDTFKNVAGGYIRGQLLLSAILSTITGVYMGLIGVPFSLFLGILSFILSFIPTIGAFTTGTIAVLLALTQGWVTVVLAIAFLIGIQLLETQILSPRIVGSAVGLHPLAALIALIIGGELFGPVGALFAAPVTGILQALLLAIWSTWRNSHPEEFKEDDDTMLEQANALEEQGTTEKK